MMVLSDRLVDPALTLVDVNGKSFGSNRRIQSAMIVLSDIMVT